MRLFWSGVCLVLTAAVSPAQTTLFDAGGFEPGAGYTSGSLNGQNGWQFDDPATNTYTVEAGAGVGGSAGIQAVGGVTNWAFPSLNYTPAANEIVRIQADIARTAPLTTDSFSYSIDVYSAAVLRTTRFGLINNGGVIQPFVTSRSTNGVFNPTAAVGTVLVGGPVAAGTFVNFDARLDYTNKFLRLFIDGVDVGSNIPFADLTAADLADADFQVSSVAGATDSGFLDNYIVTTLAPVPEPATVGLVATCALAALGAVRRRFLV